MTLCDRLIGGVVQGIADAIETVASFWQTPREVEWAKAAADGLAEREAEEEVSEPTIRYYDRAWNEVPVPPEFGGNPKTPAVTPHTAASGPAEGAAPRPPSAVVSDGVSVGGQLGGWLAGLTERVDKAGEENALCCCYLPDVMQPCGPCRTGDGDCTLLSTPSAERPAPEFDWVTTAIPVIAGVLAEHKFLPIMGRCECPSLPRVADWQRWSEHVSPIIAIAIQSDLLSTIYEDTTFAINAFSGDRPRPLADFPKHQK